MSLIVAARFQTFEEAQHAAQILFGRGYSETDVHIFFVQSPRKYATHPIRGDEAIDKHSRGAVAGAIAIGIAAAVIAWLVSGQWVVIIVSASVGVYVGSLVVGVWAMGRKSRRKAGEPVTANEADTRPAGVMLALHVLPEREAEACGMLREAGGQEVERAKGHWVNGEWQDFDPSTPREQEPAA